MGIIIIVLGIAASLGFYFINEGSFFNYYGISHAGISLIFLLYSIYTIRNFKRLFSELFGQYKSDKVSEEKAQKYLATLNLEDEEIERPLESSLLISNAINYLFPSGSNNLGQIGIMLWLSGFLNCILFAVQGQWAFIALGILYFLIMSINSSYLPNMRISNAMKYLQTSDMFKEEISMFYGDINGNIDSAKMQSELKSAVNSLNYKIYKNK